MRCAPSKTTPSHIEPHSPTRVWCPSGKLCLHPCRLSNVAGIKASDTKAVDTTPSGGIGMPTSCHMVCMVDTVTC